MPFKVCHRQPHLKHVASLTGHAGTLLSSCVQACANTGASGIWKNMSCSLLLRRTHLFVFAPWNGSGCRFTVGPLS
jgi:hypothetical protein